MLEDVPGFVESINNLPSHRLNRELVWIRDSLIFHDSAQCSAAVLDGKTKITEIPRVTSWLSKVDNRPLHYAVRHTASKITALLLQRGFSTDVRRDYGDGDEELKNALPLHVVLSQLCFNRRKELSAVELVLKLCHIQYYRRRLETLRLIAQNTTEIKREFFNYLNEGKMIEVGALLLVAKSQILSLSTATVEGEFRSISEMHNFVTTKKNSKLEETLVLLEIFDKIGDNLATLLRLDISETCLANCSVQLAASLINDAGYDVKATYFYHNDSYIRREVVCSRAIDECEKTIRTTDTLPSWVKEALLNGLADKSGSTSSLTYPFLTEIRAYMNRVSVSPLTPGSASSMPQNMELLHHLLKKAAPFLGTIKRVFRRA
ncbi:hypothetical protein KSS87_020767 [Heliosperma pusillum]|nr:hypothetical protein KSS87_020767 [Heliosperma pusillum]